MADYEYNFNDNTAQGWTLFNDNANASASILAAAANGGSGYGIRVEVLATDGTARAGLRRALPVTYQDVYVQLKFRIASGSDLGWGDNDGYANFLLIAGSDQYSGFGELRLRSDGTSWYLDQSLGAGYATALAYDTWYTLEARFVRSATVGGFRVWLNGTSVINDMTHDTTAAASSIGFVAAGALLWSGCDPADGTIFDIDDIFVDADYIGSNTTTFTVGYDGNSNTGGSAPTDSSSPYASGATVTVLGNTGSLVRTGYVFTGWNTAANGSGTAYAPAETFSISANTTLYAQWATARTVTYAGNSNTGGTSPTDSSSPYADGATVTVLGNTGSLVRTGYNFNGWNTAANGTGTHYAASGTFTISANTTLYAEWVEITHCSVTYNLNNATSGSAPTDSNTYESGATVTIPKRSYPLFLRTGYAFLGWNTAANGSGTRYHPGGTFTISANTTLYAEWGSYVDLDATNTGFAGAGYTVGELTASGGVTADTDGQVIENLNITGDITVQASNVVIRNCRVNSSGYWPVRVASGSIASIDYTTIIGTVTAEGCLAGSNWTAHYLDMSGALDGVKIGAYDTLEYSYIHDLTVDGGSHNDGIQSGGGSHSVVRRNRIIAPTGSTSAVNFTTDASAIDDIVIEENLLAGGAYTVYSRIGSFGGAPTNVVVRNNRFVNNAVYGPLSTDGTVTIQGNVWNETGTLLTQNNTEPGTIALTYNGNSNTGGTAPTTDHFAEGATVTLPLNTGGLVRTGYTLSGWNTAANGTGTHYALGGSLTMPGTALTLYAEWTVYVPSSHTVTYAANGATSGSVPAAVEVDDGNSTTLSANTGSLARTGYTFGGWRTGPTSGTVYQAGASYSPSNDVTLYAYWIGNAVTHRLYYNPRGATGGAVPTDALEYEHGDSAIVSANTGSLVKTGYTFAGWNRSYYGDGEALSPSDILEMTQDIVLYTRWIKEADVVNQAACKNVFTLTAANDTIPGRIKVVAIRWVGADTAGDVLDMRCAPGAGTDIVFASIADGANFVDSISFPSKSLPMDGLFIQTIDSGTVYVYTE